MEKIYRCTAPGSVGMLMSQGGETDDGCVDTARVSDRGGSESDES